MRGPASQIIRPFFFFYFFHPSFYAFSFLDLLRFVAGHGRGRIGVVRTPQISIVPIYVAFLVE